MKNLFFAIALAMGTGAKSQCPNFMKSQSNPYYLLYSSSSAIPDSGNPKTINNLSFVNAGYWNQSNTFYASWTNTSGQPLDINNFTIQFGNQTCTYNSATLSALEVTKDLQSIPSDKAYKVFSVDGKLLQSGITSKNLYRELPTGQVILLSVEQYSVLRMKINQR
ncbi:MULTISPECIES: hypothetical protein [Chryseobacterium]|uniref:T9SS C-terminal target domain-containing protein n=1 Tax=Chryseobacterium camelliae TaxID=1265445 RepID=A0ABU0TI32_9FLAO|nr:MULTISPECIES: hypothetical protein [Chryseobacterium]MDT3409422.1 hypothetical protein [Pseudacidovorax intermedius]MDQ1096713.1 hypothetical protein [Chryseobacterium camelliae]MDQ1100657.1 hypothetical protein [Chryseobacterium sp. SORGH_AS_1048]MDR6087995.1 hypothetical protein [Chryseobacterium sp. SORGH_AS_0909]MDR6132370.1 hypothetical protein [Chryseobacterium sp. SORGH_AS_1175]